MGKFVHHLFADDIVNYVTAILGLLASHLPRWYKDSWHSDIRYFGDYKREDCVMLPTKFWKSLKRDHNGVYQTFWWRIYPSYCAYGQPVISGEKGDFIYNNSETRKIIYLFDKLKITLDLDKFLSPTKTNWGLRPQTPYITVIFKGKTVYTGLNLSNRKWKSHFKSFMYNFIPKT